VEAGEINVLLPAAAFDEKPIKINRTKKTENFKVHPIFPFPSKRPNLIITIFFLPFVIF
jgi:hypothetical protein